MPHLFFHLLAPLLVVAIFYRKNWQAALFILMATMVIDVDHLLATPIYDSSRCSIGFHPLHQVWLMTIYFALCFFPKTNLVGVGLVIHMALDQIDCQM